MGLFPIFHASIMLYIDLPPSWEILQRDIKDAKKRKDSFTAIKIIETVNLACRSSKLNF